MNTPGFRFEPCHPGETEWMIARGPAGKRQILIAPPLFGEMNLLRRFIADIMRGLAARGVGSWLPDLPGVGESLQPIERQSLATWRAAMATAAATIRQQTDRDPDILAIRGGTLIDAGLPATHWHFAPADGAALLRQMERARLVASGDAGDGSYGGYALGPDMIAGLSAELPSVPDSVYENGDGFPLWRRAEPDRDEALAGAIVAWLTR